MSRVQRRVACGFALWFALVTTTAPGLHTHLGHDRATAFGVAQTRTDAPRDAAISVVRAHHGPHDAACLACIYLSTFHADGAPAAAVSIALAPADIAAPVDETPAIAAEHSPLSPRAPPICL